MNTVLQSGIGDGHLAAVTADGQLVTEVTNTVAVKSGSFTVTRSSVTVQVTSGALVSDRPGRRGLWVQNQGANNVYLRFEAAAATAADWLVLPGGDFKAEHFAYTGEIRAIALGGTSVVLVLEMV